MVGVGALTCVCMAPNAFAISTMCIAQASAKRTRSPATHLQRLCPATKQPCNSVLSMSAKRHAKCTAFIGKQKLSMDLHLIVLLLLCAVAVCVRLFDSITLFQWSYIKLSIKSPDNFTGGNSCLLRELQS